MQEPDSQMSVSCDENSPYALKQKSLDAPKSKIWIKIFKFFNNWDPKLSSDLSNKRKMSLLFTYLLQDDISARSHRIANGTIKISSVEKLQLDEIFQAAQDVSSVSKYILLEFVILNYVLIRQNGQN